MRITKHDDVQYIPGDLSPDGKLYASEARALAHRRDVLVYDRHRRDRVAIAARWFNAGAGRRRGDIVVTQLFEHGPQASPGCEEGHYAELTQHEGEKKSASVPARRFRGLRRDRRGGSTCWPVPHAREPHRYGARLGRRRRRLRRRVGGWRGAERGGYSVIPSATGDGATPCPPSRAAGSRTSCSRPTAQVALKLTTDREPPKSTSRPGVEALTKVSTVTRGIALDTSSAGARASREGGPIPPAVRRNGSGPTPAVLAINGARGTGARVYRIYIPAPRASRLAPNSRALPVGREWQVAIHPHWRARYARIERVRGDRARSRARPEAARCRRRSYGGFATLMCAKPPAGLLAGGRHRRTLQPVTSRRPCRRRGGI